MHDKAIPALGNPYQSYPYATLTASHSTNTYCLLQFLYLSFQLSDGLLKCSGIRLSNVWQWQRIMDSVHRITALTRWLKKNGTNINKLQRVGIYAIPFKTSRKKGHLKELPRTISTQMLWPWPKTIWHLPRSNWYNWPCNLESTWSPISTDQASPFLLPTPHPHEKFKISNIFSLITSHCL